MSSHKKDRKPHKSEEREKNKKEKYPPANQDELRAVLLEFMCSPNFEYPIDGGSLFKKLKDQYKDCDDYKQIMKNLNINAILLELKEK